MLILGIDPGYDRLGIAVIDKPIKGKEVLLYSDCFTTSPKDSIYARLKGVGNEISRILKIYKPDGIALETLFITKNQKTAMRVSEARGIIIYEALQNGVPVFEYGPMEVKMAITSDGSSGKDRIIKMVKILIDIPAKKTSTKMLDDEYDAIAVALTHSACVKSR